MKSFIAIALIFICVVESTIALQYTHAQALAKLTAAGIPVSSSGNCSDKNNKRCTSLDGIHAEAIDGPSGIIVLKRSLPGCQIIVTGGTEIGHARGPYSHENGWKLDISMRDCITSYVTRNFASIGGRKWKAGSGNVYYNEVNHWDITYAPKY